MLLGPTAQVSDCIADAGARPIERAAHQLELRDQSVVAFQELITFLGELFIEFFELVDPALQARDVAFERSSSLCNFFGMGASLPVRAKKGVIFSPPSNCRRPHLR